MKLADDHLAILAAVAILFSAIDFKRTRHQVTSIRAAFTSGNVRNLAGIIGITIYLMYYLRANMLT